MELGERGARVSVATHGGSPITGGGHACLDFPTLDNLFILHFTNYTLIHSMPHAAVPFY